MEKETIIDQPETETEVETEEGKAAVEESVSVQTLKDVLGKQLGKEFSSDEDALAAVGGLKKLVGDQKVAEDRKKAKELETLKKDPQYSALRAELETVKLQQKHPEAADYLEEIQAIADKKGVSYNEAFETSKFGKLVAEQGEKEQKRKDKIKAIPSSDKTVSNASDDDWEAATKAANDGDLTKLMRLKLPDFFGDNK